MAIPVFNPTIRRKEMDAVLTCLVSDRIGPGELSLKLLEKLSDLIRHSGGVCFREPQRALECTLLTLIPEKEGKVLISALAPGYYVDVINILGLEPLLCDVDPASGVMKVSEIEEKAAECKAIIIDYPMGNYSDFTTIASLEIPVIEDISCSIGTSAGDFQPGSLGKYVFIGMEEHNLITAGGGAVVVAHSRSDVSKLKKSYDLMDKTVLLPDMNAALATVQCSTLLTRLEKRKSYFDIFLAQLQKGGHKTLMLNGDVEELLYSFPVIVDVGHKDVIAYSKKKGVDTEIAFFHVAIDKIDPEGHDFPNALSLKLRTLLFPLYSLLGNTNAELISRVLLTLP